MSANQAQSAAPTSSSSNPSTTTKERHYAHLNARLAQLSHHTAALQNEFFVAGEQARYLRQLGASQGALFMGALHQVDSQAVEEAEAREGQAQS